MNVFVKMMNDFIYEEHERAAEELEAIKKGRELKNRIYFNEYLKPATWNVIKRYLNEGLRLTKKGDPLATTFIFRQVDLRDLLAKVYDGIDESLSKEDERDSHVKSYIRRSKNIIEKSEEYGKYIYKGEIDCILDYDFMNSVLTDAIKKIQAAEFGRIYNDNEKNRKLIAHSEFIIQELQKCVQICNNSK